MKTQRTLQLGVAAVVAAVLFAGCQSQPDASRGADPAIRVGENDLGGAVTSANGPEAGVWVIAETTDLPTKFTKIVVTDDRGHYLIPDLRGKSSTWPPWWRPARPRPRSTTRRFIGIRCSRSRPGASFPPGR